MKLTVQRAHPAHIPEGVRYAVLEDGRTFYLLRDLARAFSLPRERKGWGRFIRFTAPEHKARIAYAEACEAWPELVAERQCQYGVLAVSAEEVSRLAELASASAPVPAPAPASKLAA